MVVTRRQSTTPIPPVASRTNSSTNTSRLKDKSAGASPLKASATAGMQGTGPERRPASNGHADNPRAPVVGPQSLADIKFDDDVKPKPSSQKLPTSPPKSAPPKPKSKTKSKKVTKAKKSQKEKGNTIFDVLTRLTLLFLIIYTVSVCPEDVELRSPVCRGLSTYRQEILEPYVYPHIRTVLDHPSVAPHVQRIQPYYEGAIKATKPVIRRGRHEWRTKVIPQIRWMQLHARPYVRKAERQFDKTFGPYIRQLSTQYHYKVALHVTEFELLLQDKWKAAQPWVHPMWRAFQRLPLLIRYFVVKPLGEARKQYVDPHVAKMWDSIMEQSKANTENLKTAAQSSLSSLSHTSPSSTVPSDEAPEPTSVVAVSTSDLEPTSEVVPASEKSEAEAPPAPAPTEEVLEETAEVTQTEIPSPPQPTEVLEETLTASEAGIEVDVPIPAPTDEAAIVVASVVEERLSPHTDTPRVAVSIEDEDLDATLDEFFSELDGDAVSETEPESQQPPVQEETPEEIEERLKKAAQETAEKRADIVGRHLQWEKDIEKLGNSQKETVVATLDKLREAAIEEARSPNGAIRSQVDGLNVEAEKSLKALKAYGKKLTGDEGKDEPEKIKNFLDVVMKVEKKFEQKVEKAGQTVMEWWTAQVNNELKEIQLLGEAVYDLALEAQADLGMDYAWLADVTYLDWQRYHQLVDRSKNFTAIYQSLQNGTAPDAPVNHLQEEIEGLQEEVDDMILGFEASLGIVKRSVLDQFSIDAGTDTPPAPASSESSEPTYSILPIGPGPSAPSTEGKAKLEGISQVILSPDPVEIKEAAARVEEESAKKAAHGEL